MILSKKNIAVNGQDHTITRSGGAGRYAQQLYKRMIFPEAEILAEFEFRTMNFSTMSQKLGYGNNILSSLKNTLFQCSPPIFTNVIQKACRYAKNYVLKSVENPENIGAASIINSTDWTNICLLHELTNYMSHSAVGRLSLSPKLALAVTFLDIQDYFYPEYFEDKVLSSRRMMYSFYKDRADIFIAISEFTKQTMVEKLGINSSKIRVTHLAADDLVLFQPSQEIKRWVESFGRYWIYPAKIWKHKNHDFLLEALGKRRSELMRAGIKFLLTGGFNEDDSHRLGTMIHENSLDDIVKILGFVSDEQLQLLLKRAEFLVFPSLFEGFGMPILEAMTLGCPVISSNAGSLPEVAGDSAMYFDPKCEDEFVALIDSIISENGIDRKSMIERGYENCKRFSWNRTFHETVKVYRELLQ